MPNEKVGKYILWLAINPCGYHDAARVIVIQKITYSACQNQVFVLGNEGERSESENQAIRKRD